jgi:hypothetical protein
MFVNYNPDSLKGGAESGTYRLQGNKYVEALSWAKSNYVVKVEGNKFHQEGTLIYPDGKKWILKEVYNKVTASASSSNADVVGTWNMTSLNTIKDGEKDSKKTELQIITPTHFIWVDKKEGQVVGAMFGTYIRQGTKVIPSPIIASFTLNTEDKVDIDVTLKGDQMFTKGTMTKKDETKESWKCVHQKIGKAKLAKAVSN